MIPSPTFYCLPPPHGSQSEFNPNSTTRLTTSFALAMSAILSAGGLNDLISPGVACIKPVETFPHQPPPPPSSAYKVRCKDNLTSPALPCRNLPDRLPHLLWPHNLH